jgi:hypothetical protein
MACQTEQAGSSSPVNKGQQLRFRSDLKLDMVQDGKLLGADSPRNGTEDSADKYITGLLEQAKLGIAVQEGQHAQSPRTRSGDNSHRRKEIIMTGPQELAAALEEGQPASFNVQSHQLPQSPDSGDLPASRNESTIILGAMKAGRSMAQRVSGGSGTFRHSQTRAADSEFLVSN